MMINGILQDSCGKLVIHTEMTNRLLEKTCGLIGKPAPSARSGLLLTRCRSIHTFFMHYSIDVIFMSRDFNVISIRTQLKPYRFAWCYGAYHTLEMAAGEVERLHINVADNLFWSSK